MCINAFFFFSYMHSNDRVGCICCFSRLTIIKLYKTQQRNIRIASCIVQRIVLFARKISFSLWIIYSPLCILLVCCFSVLMVLNLNWALSQSNVCCCFVGLEFFYMHFLSIAQFILFAFSFQLEGFSIVQSFDTHSNLDSKQF